MTETNHQDTEDDAVDELAQIASEASRALPGRRYTVTMEDGLTFVTRTTNREFVGWDKTAPRHKWGAASDVPFLALSFTVWAAARREQLLDAAVNFDKFLATCEHIEPVKADRSDVAVPSQSEVEDGLS